MAKKSDIVIGIIMLSCVVIFGLFFITMIFGSFSSGGLDMGVSKVAVVEVFGLIYDSRSVIRQLDKYDNDESIQAIIIHLNSPGGAIVPSHEIYDKIRKIRDKGDKPVISSMSSLAASGAYYIACGTDSIMADPGTMTGSVGVIMEFMNTADLFEKVGVKFNAITSGKYKDAGSPHRKMTADERKYFQGLIDDSYSQFAEVVSVERKMKLAKVKEIADGRVFTGKQAKKLGLVDLLGTFDDAVELAKEMAGITGKVRIVKERRTRHTLFDLLFGDLEKNLYEMQGAPFLEYRMNH